MRVWAPIFAALVFGGCGAGDGASFSKDNAGAGAGAASSLGSGSGGVATSSGQGGAGGDVPDAGTDSDPPDGGPSADASDGSASADAAAESDASDASTAEAGDDSGPPSNACVGDTLHANRNRLLESYFQYLKTSVTAPQTNGLFGDNVMSALDLWQKLDPSSQAVFLTLTARMQGSLLGSDSTSMLSHITAVYRVSGGQGATATTPGSCGGGEYNRMIMSMDAPLRAALLAASEHKGAKQSNAKYDLGDVVPSSAWRDSHDLGGPHAPFDRSDETRGGAPRAQTHYFADPTSSRASSPLGRQDLATLVDPNALELDQDYDCVHSSNPLCTYVTYGPYCVPQPSELGTQVYVDSYGSFDEAWQPVSCDP